MGHQIKLSANGTYTLTTKDTWCEDDITLLVDVAGGVGDLKATSYSGSFTAGSMADETLTLHIVSGGKPLQGSWYFGAKADDTTISASPPYPTNLLSVIRKFDGTCHETYCSIGGAFAKADAEGTVTVGFDGTMTTVTIDPQNAQWLRVGRWNWFLVCVETIE